VASRRTRLARVAAGLAALALASCTAGVPRTGEVVTVSPVQSPPPVGDESVTDEGSGPAAGLSDTQVALGFMSSMNTARPETIERWMMPKAAEQVRTWSTRTTVNVYHALQPDPPAIQDGRRIVPVRLDMVGRLERGREWTPRSDEDTLRLELQKAGAEWRVANPGKELWVRDVDFKKLYTPVEMFLLPAGGAAGDRLAPVPVFVRRAPPGTPAPQVLQARARDAVLCMLDGPDGRYVHLTSAIPTNTKLRSLVYEKGVVTVDLSSRFTDTSTGGTGKLRVGQLVWTINRLIQTAQVRIRVEGRPLGSIGLDGFQGAGPWQRNRPEIAGLWPQRSSVGDGDTVLFARGGELYTIPPDANQAPKVIGFNAPSPKSAPTWSPDHHWIAFLATSGQEQGLWLLQPGAQASPTGLTGRLSPPSWSAESARLYLLNRTKGGTRLVEVTRRTLGVVERDLPALPGGMRPTSLAVSPDGAWVLAVADHGDPQPGDGGQLFLGRFGPEGVLGWYNRPIAPGLGRVFSPVWVDALTVAFIAETDNKDDIGRLWVMKRDGWDPTAILNADPEGAPVVDIGRQLTVDPSGSSFIFTVRSQSGASLWIVDRQGISPRPLTQPTAKEFDTDPSFASR
jgi:Sporulation and spore germination/Lipoprotein LpqB beta-propeller domain